MFFICNKYGTIGINVGTNLNKVPYNVLYIDKNLKRITTADMAQISTWLFCNISLCVFLVFCVLVEFQKIWKCSWGSTVGTLQPSHLEHKFSDREGRSCSYLPWPSPWKRTDRLGSRCQVVCGQTRPAWRTLKYFLGNATLPVLCALPLPKKLVLQSSGSRTSSDTGTWRHETPARP